jgi:hypothetical protein
MLTIFVCIWISRFDSRWGLVNVSSGQGSLHLAEALLQLSVLFLSGLRSVFCCLKFIAIFFCGY